MNFVTYNYNSTISSDLSTKKILMLGRANDKKKRFKLGILSMEYIIQEIPQCELTILSNLTGINAQQDLINNLNLEDNIKFIGYSSIPDIFFNKVSLNIFPSISESFGLVLSETKLYGIPNILLGLDYVSISKGGTIIIYDETPESLAKNAIRILNNSLLRSKLGREAKKSMLKFNNNLLSDKWANLIIAIYKGNEHYEAFREKVISVETLIRNHLNILNLLNFLFSCLVLIFPILQIFYLLLLNVKCPLLKMWKLFPGNLISNSHILFLYLLLDLLL